MNSFDALPEEMVEHILSFLPQHEIGVAAQVCERWADIVRAPFLWRSRHIVLKEEGALTHEVAQQLSVLSIEGVKCKMTPTVNAPLLPLITCLKYLDLSNSFNLQDDDVSHLHTLTQLTNLNLSWQEYLTKTTVHLSGLSRLKSLNLRQCGGLGDGYALSKMPDLFPDLTALNLIRCRIGGLTHLMRLTRLKALHLSLCRRDLTAVPDEIPQLTSLVTLDISENHIQTLFDSFSQLTRLKFLDLGCNKLTQIPQSCCTLSSLLILNARSNQLRSLPDCLLQLRSLTKLNCSENNLTALPEAMCTSLRYLDLSYNQISFLPPTVSRLTSLTLLVFDSNQIIHLPDISSLQSLKFLSLNRNHISSFPECFLQLAALTYLSCNECEITHLPNHIGNLTSLYDLNLKCNQIKSLPDSFSKLTSLTVLNLEENGLTSFTEGFLHLTNLKYLYLSINPLPDVMQRSEMEDMMDIGPYYGSQHFTASEFESYFQKHFKNKQQTKRTNG